MIDTDKYEGHTEGPWYLIGAQQIVYDKDNNPIAEVEYFAQEHRSYYNKALIVDAPLLLEEVKRLREELDTIKSDRSFEHRFSPTAYGMANEAWRGLTESGNSVNETFDDLRLLTEEEWWQWQEEDMDWPWDCDEIVDALDDAHHTYLRKCIDMLEKEGGIMALKKRLQESGEE